MKYQPPTNGDLTNADRAYVNANPGAGVEGSYPAAAAIEHPQREILRVITDAGLVPDAADLQQLSKALKKGRVFYAADTGVANAYVAAIVPGITAYAEGLSVLVKIANKNTGASTININALGAKSIKNVDGTGLVAGQLIAGAVVLLVYDGTNFQAMIKPPCTQAVSAAYTPSIISGYRISEPGSDGKSIIEQYAIVGTNSSGAGIFGFPIAFPTVAPVVSLTPWASEVGSHFTHVAQGIPSTIGCAVYAKDDTGVGTSVTVSAVAKGY